MEKNEAAILFQAVQQAQRKYEAKAKVPVNSMPGKIAFEQGYIQGFQEALESVTKDLRVALKSLVDDAHSGDDNLWRIGPYDNSPDSRLGFARKVLGD